MLYKVFDEVEVKTQLLAKKYWNNFSTEISEHLPDTYQPEIQKLSRKLDEALSTLVEALRNPTLTLATTGTTSSRKSTWVNLGVADSRYESPFLGSYKTHYTSFIALPES